MMNTHRRCLLLIALALTLVPACASDRTHDGPLVDVRPHKLGVGDDLIVEGVTTRGGRGGGTTLRATWR